ncbi:uncharacterized protein LTR77_009327 [Saxophila tyrrhenica]|uniref:Uncharacterized protein n=1 Tax=Saxophila tyrrhenica TaxID=1690608 RepID=A0AAV9P0S1_9PEZI|nr:hypothetical protein LTR77_009327 [Saxophila tyrrhenica]
MPIWPFRKRRRSAKDDVQQQPLSEKAQPEQPPTRAATDPSPPSTQPIAIPRKTSKRADEQPRAATFDEKATEASLMRSKQAREASHKENVPPSSSYRRHSREDITALPLSRKLDSSPHLRPIDSERPHIPYNFRPYSTSQTSIQPEPNMSPPPRQPNKLRSRRSQYDSATPSRRQSSKRRKDDRVREEEIRAMGAQSPIPKRPGDGPLRRDSKKMRSYGIKDSYVSLPQSDDVDSNMTGIAEQRGWELGSFDMFNPRPAVRLSGTPQYIAPSSMPSPSPIAEMVERDKEKMPAKSERTRKRETIGVRADDLDASDLRMLMERDAKRREQKKKEQQEKLDRKLRNRNGRNRGDSDRKRREAEEERREDEAKQRAEEERRGREMLTPPTDIHPALRDRSEDRRQLVDVPVPVPQTEPPAREGAEEYGTPAEQPENPFTDAAVEQEAATPPVEQMPGAFSPVQTPMEDPVIETAREMKMAQTATPPLSPVRTGATASSLPKSMDARRASETPLPPPPITDQRRHSDQKMERRAGAWATFFRRGGTNLRKDGTAPSEASFSNTSRESMRNQPLPAHLVDTQAQAPRRKSGTPARTQSKFREDLPEMPISPPDSRMPSPDVTLVSAAAAAARRKARSSAPNTVPEDVTMPDADQPSSYRNDTPISPSIRSNRMMSMASVDSEGSWLASGATNRHSTQSGVNRSIGSLNQRFTGSYEELGRDADGEYFQRGQASSPDTKRTKLSTLAALTGDNVPDEESDEDGVPDLSNPSDPMTMHESVRRQPTLVHRDPRVKSREGLLTEFAGAETPEPDPESAATGGRGSMFGFDTEEEGEEEVVEVKRAGSVDYGSRGHARQISAGSARLIGSSRGGRGEGIEEEPPVPGSTPR